MKVLILCNKPPYPPKEGGPIAMNAIIMGLLQNGIDIKILSVNSNKYNIDINNIPAQYRQQTGIELVDIDLSVKPLGALRNLLLNRSYSIERFYSKDFEKKLIEILSKDDFDIVQIELLHLSPYIDIIRKYSKAKIVLRAHNVEHLIWERIYNNERNPIKKLYLKHVAKTLKEYELGALDKYDLILPITCKDADFFRNHTNTNIEVVPFGVVPNYSEVSNNNHSDIKTFFHLGSMDYQPNIEGVDWFINNVWSRIREHVPDAKLVLAGRNMPERMFKMHDHEGISILGEVADSTKFMLDNGIMIVPLLSGSGIRIKIIEGMSLGKPIVTTSVGAEGLEYTNHTNIMIADNPNEFANECIRLYNDSMLCNTIGHNAKELINKKHNRDVISSDLVKLYKKL